MTVRRFFETYPISITLVAKELKMDRTALSKKISKGKLSGCELDKIKSIINILGICFSEISKTLTND